MFAATFAAIAAEVGMDERSVRRIVAAVLRRMATETDAGSTDVVLAALKQGLRANDFSTEMPTILRPARRFSVGVGSDGSRDARPADGLLSRPRGARPPRRFPGGHDDR
jgi:hypothetical protein